MMDVSSGDVSVGDMLVPSAFSDDRVVSDVALDYFNGVLSNQALPVNYVVYPGNLYTYVYNGQEYEGYEYCMAYGDISFVDGRFVGIGTVCTLRVDDVTYTYDQVLDLSVSMYYGRSNLGDYSGIVHYDWFGMYLAVAVTLGGVVWFLKKLMRLKY